MKKQDIQYGITPIYKICRNGNIEEYVVSGYAEREVWVEEEKSYRIATYVYGRNDSCTSSCFTMSNIGENHFTCLIGRDAFFDIEELQKELKRREQKKENLQQAKISEINKFGMQKKRR